MLDNEEQALVLYLARCSLARTSKDDNWVDDVGGLPEYICSIARAVHRGGRSISESISIAVGRVKAWSRGEGDVTAATRAKAAKALAEWEEKKAAAKLDNKVKASMVNLSYNVDNIRKQYREVYGPGESKWVRELWNDHLIVMIETDENTPASFVKVPYIVDAKTGIATFGTEVPVKQTYVEFSDKQLEVAAKIPCTEKANRSLLETVRLSHKLKMEESELMKLSASVRNLV